jgi:hypothetical protein
VGFDRLKLVCCVDALAAGGAEAKRAFEAMMPMRKTIRHHRGSTERLNISPFRSGLHDFARST